MSSLKVKKIYLEVLQPVEKEEEGFTYVDYDEIKLPFVITRISTRQITKVVGLIGAILDKAKGNEEIMEFIRVQLGLVGEEFMDKDTGELLGELRDRNAGNLMETIVFLTKELPDEAYELISELSGIHVETLDLLDLEQTMEVLEACLEVNDVKMIQKSVKKFSDNLITKFRKEMQSEQAKANHPSKARPRAVPTKE